MAENPDLGLIQQTIEGLAGNAAKPERAEAGPGDVEPTVTTAKPTPLIPVPMSEDECGKWWERIKRAQTRRDNRVERWDILLKEYLPIVAKTGQAETIKYNGHFRNVHSKLPQLFFRKPDLILLPRDPGPTQQTMPNPAAMATPGAPPVLKMEDIVSLKQSVLDDALGREGIKAARLMDELLFDVLAWSGIAACKVGYRCVQKTVQTPVMGPDPNALPPAPQSPLGLSPTPAPAQVPQMGPDGQPQMQPTTSTIFEEWFARRFSPKKLLLPDDLRSTRYDEDATWKGMEFFMAPDRAKKLFGVSKDNPQGLTDEEINHAADDDLHATYEEDQKGDKSQGLVHGIEIYCKSEYFTDDQPHPQAFHQLILIEGVKNRPVVWRPCPDQTFDEMGRLTPDSIDKNPIQVLAIRDLADSPFPEADSAFTNQNVKAIGTWRRQSIALRDRAIGKYFYDLDALDDGDIDRLKNAEVGDYIGVEAGKLDKGADKILVPTAKVTNTQDDYRNAQLLKTDNDETLGISSSDAGGLNDTIHTATEVNNASNSAAGRNDKEMSRVTDFYLDIARLVDQYLMRYATTDRYTNVIGAEGAQTLAVWNSKMVMGRWLYDIAPDSQLRVDTARDFQLALNFYNLAAKDPLMNRTYILKRLARMRGFDPNKAVLPPPPPPAPKPDPPKINFTYKPEDIAILMASNDPLQVKLAELLVQMLSQAMVTAQAAPTGPNPQPPHGGSGEAVNQHTASNSGKRQNEPGAENHREMPK